MIKWLALAILATTPALADPTDDALRFGTIATTAPLCGLRDDLWARDLRTAETQALAHHQSTNQATATLSYAEDEAAESFAEAKPKVTCDKLRNDPSLRQADDIVKQFRAGAKV